MDAIINKVIALTVGAVLVGALLPVGVASIINANTTGWGTANIALWGVVTIMLIVAVVILFVKIATSD